MLVLAQRLGRSPAGLVVIELGWTLVLVLAAQLTNRQGEPHVLGVLLSTVWAVGGALIVFAWALYSKVYAFVLSPLLIIVKPPIDLVFTLLIVPVGLINLALLVILIPLNDRARERLKTSYQIRSADYYWRTHPGAAAAEVEADLEKRADFLDQLADENARPRTDLLIHAARRLGDLVLTPLSGGIRIGVAPLSPQSGPSGLRVTTSPEEQFGAAIATLGARLTRLPGFQHVEFYALPALSTVSTERQARFLRWLFHVDVLLWGRFEGQKGDNAWIWVTRKRESAVASQDTDYGEEFMSSFFPSDPAPLDVGVARCSAEAPLDLHLLLVIATLVALDNRRPSGGVKWWRKVARRLRKRVDKLGSGSKLSDDIRQYVAFEVMPLVSDDPERRTLAPSCAGLAADIVSAWAGHQLSDHWAVRENRSLIGEGRFMGQLRVLLEQCVRLSPDKSIHRYRLGAVECFLGDEKGALKSFSEAMKLDKLSWSVRPIGSAVIAQMELGPSRVIYEDLNVVRFAAYTACAVAVADETSLGHVRDRFKELQSYSIANSITRKTATAVAGKLLQA